MTSISATKNINNIIYIYDLPYLVRLQLCKILNNNNKWMELAGTWMQYDTLTIKKISKDANPTDVLLTKWEYLNHKIDELFVLLSRMQHYQAMEILKPFVHHKYHALLNNGEANFFNLNNNNNNTDESNDNKKDSKIGTQNFHQVSTNKCQTFAKVPAVKQQQQQ
ncbi:hypothetical protein HCN44_007672 [Aphidius gifuensis]|uniref:Death domain-containing protein n=1 Tax=Aphidius gifuensis TaxID=684658 RepID=A0A834XKY8_APHGI|nr:hypothetical protein HCN44_007672 [Aphidius gifuensis]